MSAVIPKNVKVGPHIVDIVFVGELDGFFGDYNRHTERIRVATDVSKTQIADTLWHEVLHAIYYLYGIKDEHEEEQVVTVMATATCQVMQDNPKLMKFMSENLKL